MSLQHYAVFLNRKLAMEEIMKKAILSLILAVAMLPVGLFAEKGATPAYLLSIFIGFGSGHAYAESSKWSNFLLSD